MHKKRYTKVRLLIMLLIITLLVIVGILAPCIAPNNPYETNMLLIRKAPSIQYPFGTDIYGRCVFSRVLMGVRLSVFSAIALVFILFAFGSVIGILCGYYGKIFDAVIMRITDILLSFPEMILAIAVAGVLGGGLFNAMLALGLTGWTSYARIARSHVMKMKEEDFIHMARISGNSNFKIMVKHMLPHVMGSLLINATVQIGSTMVGIAGLSFLGLGVKIPQAEWGSMISEARSYFQLAPWMVIAPAAAIIITVMIFNYTGDLVRDILDPQKDV